MPYCEIDDLHVLPDPARYQHPGTNSDDWNEDWFEMCRVENSSFSGIGIAYSVRRTKEYVWMANYKVVRA